MPSLSPDSPILRLIAAVLGLAAAIIGVTTGLSVIGTMEQTRLHQEHQDAARIVRGLESESFTRLRQAVRELRPDCSPETLQTLRRWLLASEFISEFGIVDRRGNLVCTTTDGRLQKPAAPKVPDAVYAVPHSDEVFELYFNRELLLTDQGLVSTIIALPPFDLIVNPFQLHHSYALGIGVLRLVLPSGETRIAYRAPAMSIELVARLNSREFVDRDASLWDLPTRAYLSSSRVPNSSYVIQTAVPFAKVIERYRPLLVTLSILTISLAWLTYLATLPILRAAFSFDAQVEKLLRTENIVCVLQPVYNLQSGALAGAELLMRLADGKHLAYPNQIIPTVLRKKLTDQFDRAVITRAALDLQRLSFPRGFKLSLNFFPSSFVNGLAQSLLREQFAEARGRGLQVCLEITEQQVSSDLVGEIQELKQLGYLISIDDFGTGFSNLGSVKRLAPHCLKIDRSFVCDMEDQTVRSTLIPEIIQIARAVGAEVVAEGIENRSQIERLKTLGTEFGQGFFLGKPMSFAEFGELLDAAHTNRP